MHIAVHDDNRTYEYDELHYHWYQFDIFLDGQGPVPCVQEANEEEGWVKVFVQDKDPESGEDVIRTVGGRAVMSTRQGQVQIRPGQSATPVDPIPPQQAQPIALAGHAFPEGS